MSKRPIREILLTPIRKTCSISTAIITTTAILLLCLYFYAKHLPIYHPKWHHGHVVCEGAMPTKMKIVVEVKHIDDPEFQELIRRASLRCR